MIVGTPRHLLRSGPPMIAVRYNHLFRAIPSADATAFAGEISSLNSP
jgi:hypothetical protein